MQNFSHLDSFVSLAMLEPQSGKEENFIAVLSELYGLMERKGYSKDELFRDHQDSNRYFHLRHWTSAQARVNAREDPEVHRLWVQLAGVCQMRWVEECLEPVAWR